MAAKKSDKCEVCGDSLVYASKMENYQELACYFCGKSFNTNIYCKKLHYICNVCHSEAPNEVIERICEETNIKDPFELADLIMKHPNFKIYGPEHHVLTPAVILTALKNNSIKKPNGEVISLFDIKEAIRRASKIPGGCCGFYGSCGAGIGTGIAISVFTNATPSTNQARSLANLMTSRSLKCIADNLEHCCKRAVKISIYEILVFLKEKFEIELNYLKNKCIFSEVNDRCEKRSCPMF